MHDASNPSSPDRSAPEPTSPDAATRVYVDYIPGRFCIALYRDGMPDRIVKQNVDWREAKALIDVFNEEVRFETEDGHLLWMQASVQPIQRRMKRPPSEN